MLSYFTFVKKIGYNLHKYNILMCDVDVWGCEMNTLYYHISFTRRLMPTKVKSSKSFLSLNRFSKYKVEKRRIVSETWQLKRLFKKDFSV